MFKTLGYSAITIMFISHGRAAENVASSRYTPDLTEGTMFVTAESPEVEQSKT